MNAPVLIVDDSLTVRMDLVEAFETAGFLPRPCATLAEARRALASDRVALVILDVLLPDGDGLELLREIRAERPGMTPPVLLLSTEAEVKDRILGLQTRADEYVGKPVRPYVLLNRVKRLLSTHSRRGPRWARVLPPSPGAGGSGQRWVSNRSLPPRTGEHL